LIESTFQQVEILHPLENSFQLTLDHHKEWINKSKTTRHTQKTINKVFHAFHLDLDTSKHLVQHVICIEYV